MSNFAALVQALTISGSRKSDGTANAGGTVYCYRPDSTTPVNVYANADATTIVTQPITLDEGGRIPRANYPDGLFVTEPVRLLVQDSSAAIVSDSTLVPGTAGATGVDNDGFSDSTLDAVLTDAFTSFGGQDWKYKESGGATSRTVHDKFQEQGIWVTDFAGVDPTGVGVSTTGIQNAINRAKALSTNVLFPAGTFKTDQACTLTSAAGVKLIGQGRGVTVITPTNGTANCFTFSACASSGISGMSILHTTGSTGAAVSVGGASPNFKAADLYIPADATYVGFAYGLDFSSTSGLDLLSHCQIVGSTRTLRLNCSSTTTPSVLISNALGATGADPVPSTVCIEFNGSRAGYSLVGNFIYGDTSAILYNAAFTGARVRMFGNVIFSTGATTIDMSAFAADRDLLRQWGNDVDGYTVNVLSGATVTPDRSKGRHIRIAGTTTGSAYTVAAPTPAPSLGSLYDLDLYISFVNAAGGAITGWTMNAAYHLSAGPSTTDTQVTSYHLKWDVTASVWREFSRTVTT